MANYIDGQGQNSLIPVEISFTRNAHVHYKSSNIYYLEVMTNMNLKKKLCQGQKV